MTESVVFHCVIVRAPSEHTAAGWRMAVPPVDAFDPALVRIVPVGEIRPGDTVIGTIQPHYDQLLNTVNRAQWVSYFSHGSKPQTGGARPFDAQHCRLCAHNAEIRVAGPDH